MPTIFRKGPYRFYFHSHEPNEPPHVHIDRDASSAKFWLEPVELARNIGFPPKELRIVRDIILENKKNFLEVWYGYFGIIG
ncbi:MAG: DUF4160 domain-containing protein [Candidatus Aminicenantes bacterium]|nr:DUF4160 domain-containing protein [Candidatus Aminicenantes bacterium]